MTRGYPPAQPLTADRVPRLLRDPARRRLLAQIRAAETPEQVEAALAAHRAWLVRHPDDEGMLAAGHVLLALQESLAPAAPAP